MTTKRFTINGKEIIQDKEIWCMANSEHCADVIAEALNMLCEENKQLKTVINRYEKYSNKKNDELNFRQLDILKLKEENEQLKQQISDLRKENYGNMDGIAFYQEENASLRERIADLEELNRIYVDFLVEKGYELSDVMKYE